MMEAIADTPSAAALLPIIRQAVVKSFQMCKKSPRFRRTQFAIRRRCTNDKAQKGRDVLRVKKTSLLTPIENILVDARRRPDAILPRLMYGSDWWI